MCYPKVELITYTDNPEETIALAAKVCYSKLDIGDIDPSADIENFIVKLRNVGHFSPFEHASFTFAISGISRACSHQLVRHRLASYSQKSQRYVRENKPVFVIPDSIVQSKFYTAFIERCDALYECYMNMINNGIPEEDARYILPNATPTQLVMTMNARELIHFCQLRLCNRAQKEIQQLATEIASILISKFPVIFSNGILLPKCLSEGKCPEGSFGCNSPLPSEIRGLYDD